METTDNRYAEAAPILDEVRYRYKLVDWETYLYFMHDQDCYYDVADRLVHLMTEDEAAAYEWGEFPKWFHEVLDIYEMENFGTKASDHL